MKININNKLSLKQVYVVMAFLKRIGWETWIEGKGNGENIVKAEYHSY